MQGEADVQAASASVRFLSHGRWQRARPRVAEKPACERAEADRHRHPRSAVRLAARIAAGGDSLGHGLWEVRTRLPSRIARTVFCVADETIILLHGFIKKTRTTPELELTLARKRKHDYEQAQD